MLRVTVRRHVVSCQTTGLQHLAQFYRGLPVEFEPDSRAVLPKKGDLVLNLEAESSFDVAQRNGLDSRTMPVEFEVVGEHLEDPAHLLVLGADGAYYDYDLAHERLAPTEPDARWLLLSTPDDASE